MSNPNEPNPQNTQKPVWIKCRAREGCEGQTAVIVFNHQNSPVEGVGTFIPTAGGRSIRYRCLTCKNVFHISS